MLAAGDAAEGSTEVARESFAVLDLLELIVVRDSSSAHYPADEAVERSQGSVVQQCCHDLDQ